jgi:hypothetical protein
MNKEFLPYELAMKLKTLGFDEPCFAYYKDMKGEKVLLYDSMDFDGECNTPLYQQAFRWFRESGLCIVIKPIDDKKLELGYNLLKNGLMMSSHPTYEEAELSCLTKLIKITEKHEN